MGWDEFISEQIDMNNAYTKNQTHMIEIEDWNPPENDDQAMMCIRKFDYDGWEIFVEGDVMKVVIFNADDEPETEVYAREEAEGDLTLAISLACAKATGWKDD